MTKNVRTMIIDLRKIVACFVVVAAFSCSQPEGFQEPEDPLDAGREFIRATLDGDFEKASLYIIEDQEDKEIYERYEAYMKKQPKPERLKLKSASIIINKVEKLSDSVTIINFSNSYTMKPTDLKVLKMGNTWKVDFSYTFSGNLPVHD